MNHIMRACIRCSPGVKKGTCKFFFPLLPQSKSVSRRQEITLNWDEDKECTWEIQGQTFQAEGTVWDSTVKNMALSGNQEVTEYDLHIGWHGGGYEITQYERPYMRYIRVSAFSSVIIFHGVMCTTGGTHDFLVFLTLTKFISF